MPLYATAWVLSLIHIFDVLYGQPVQAAVKQDVQVKELLVAEIIRNINHGVPVSYTHLDVYKRQAWICPMTRWLSRD